MMLMTTADSAISLKNVFFSYGNDFVIKDVSLSICRGDFVGIIGPNGGGKTTLLRLMLGVIRPSRGSVLLLGGEPEKTRMQVGYVPQETSSNKLFPISVADVALMGKMGTRGLFHSYTKEDRQRVDAVLETLAIASLKNKSIGELSGGQRQKVLLARALVGDPTILFLDEPTASIDAKGRDDLYDHLRSLNDAGTTVLLVTHNVGAVSSYIKSIACVNQEVFFHADGVLDETTITKAYGCPVDIIAHGLPHRVYRQHEGKTSEC
jgi:zinc transport system ATP-binding protein